MNGDGSAAESSGRKKSFFPFLVEIEEVDSVSKEKSSICWVKTEKCDTKLQYVIQTKVNLLGPLYWISEGIYLKKKNLFFFFFLFFLSVWVTAFIIFQKQSWSKQLTDKRGFSHDTFLGSAVPRDQSSILWMDKHTISPREKISK